MKPFEYILVIQENWDSYEELVVKFVRRISISDFHYYLFEDITTNKIYYLSPRYIGQKIEDVIPEEKVVVNISKQEATTSPVEIVHPKTYAIGTLQVLSNSNS